MTIRERLADWISGGALTRAREDAAFQRRQCRAWQDELCLAGLDLAAIADATRDGKSGTATRNGGFFIPEHPI